MGSVVPLAAFVLLVLGGLWAFIASYSHNLAEFLVAGAWLLGASLALGPVRRVVGRALKLEMDAGMTLRLMFLCMMLGSVVLLASTSGIGGGPGLAPSPPTVADSAGIRPQDYRTDPQPSLRSADSAPRPPDSPRP